MLSVCWPYTPQCPDSTVNLFPVDVFPSRFPVVLNPEVADSPFLAMDHRKPMCLFTLVFGNKRRWSKDTDDAVTRTRIDKSTHYSVIITLVF